MITIPKINCDIPGFTPPIYDHITTFLWPHDIERLERRVQGVFAKSFQNEWVWNEIKECMKNSDFLIASQGFCSTSRKDIESYYSLMTTIVVGDLDIETTRIVSRIFCARCPLLRFNALAMHVAQFPAQVKEKCALNILSLFTSEFYENYKPYHTGIYWEAFNHLPTCKARMELALELGIEMTGNVFDKILEMQDPSLLAGVLNREFVFSVTHMSPDPAEANSISLEAVD